MYRISIFAIAAICLIHISSDAAWAQFYNPYNNNPYNSGYNNAGGYNMYGGANQTDPRLGYCLKNDCFAQQGCNQCGGGYGGGCGDAIVVRVRVNGQNATPAVQSYYPGVGSGCATCIGNNTQPANAAGLANYPTTPPQTTTGRPQTQRATYRYKF